MRSPVRRFDLWTAFLVQKIATENSYLFLTGQINSRSIGTKQKETKLKFII
jgi:hypothetical protein